MLIDSISKPFQVVSKLGVRYTGIFDHISQEDQTICLAQGGYRQLSTTLIPALLDSPLPPHLLHLAKSVYHIFRLFGW